MAPKRAARKRAKKEECIINSLPSELIEQVFLSLPRLQVRCGAPTACPLLYPPILPKRVVCIGEPYPSDAILFDETWSPSTCAVPVIGPDDLICGSCNGLLCLYTPTSVIKIANLATGECLHIWLSTITKEYKIIHFLQERDSHTRVRCNVIQVYTLGDEKWKDVVTPEALSLNCVKKSGAIIVDGAMYWLNEDGRTNWQHVVMSFDLAKESFAWIQLPAVDFKEFALGDRKYWISEIDGNVCVSTAQCLHRMLIFKMQIWKLNENADQRWSQKYSIQISSLFARGLHFVHGDKILIQDRDSNLYSYEVPGMNFEIESSKMVKLLSLYPRENDDIHFYVCVKSVVPLDVFAKAAIVRRPRQGGWKLKKWKAWEHEFSRIEKLWTNIHEIELDVLERAQSAGMRAKEVLQHLPDEIIRQRKNNQIDEILKNLPDCPDERPRPIRRLNWVEKIRSFQMLKPRMDVLDNMVTVSDQAIKDIRRTLE
ncbi:hypothetical protein ACP4OV_030512 [Aristida adscensionis]